MLEVGKCIVFLTWVEVGSLPEATGSIQQKATNNKPTEKILFEKKTVLASKQLVETKEIN